MDFPWGTLNISEDQMTASVILNPPTEGTEYEITERLLRGILSMANITAHPREEGITELVTEHPVNTPVVIAEGKPAVNGEDGYYTFHIPTEDMKAKPIINEDGSVDYKNSLKLAIVEAGELIAEYTPGTAGVWGYDLHSTVIAPRHGKELPPLHGHGVLSNERKTEYRAEYSGHITKNDNTITIEPLFRVSQDVDLETGNIHFNGDVEIGGDVRSGMTVEANGNIFIRGHVGACTICAKKNITIEKGIQGKGECLVRADGDVACKFVESCRIEARGNVYAESVLNSVIMARNQVTVDSRSGVVLSSSIRGMLGVTVKEAGNDNGTTTVLQSGVPTEEIRQVQEWEKKLRELDYKLQSLEQHYRAFEGMPESNPEVAELRTKVMRAKVVVASEEKKIHDSMDPVKALIEQSKRESFIKISGVAHEGIRIHINGIHYKVPESIMDVTYRVVGSQIVADANE